MDIFWIIVIFFSLGLLIGSGIGFYAAMSDAERKHHALTRKLNNL